LRGRWKYKLLVYDYGDHDWGRRWHDFEDWLHIYFSTGILFVSLNWDNVSIIVYLLDVEVFVKATLPRVAANADITFCGNIAILESAGAVKCAIYLVFSFVRPDAALNLVFLVSYKDDIFGLSLFIRETHEDLCSEVEVSSVSTQKPAECHLCIWASECILGF
jgi:ribosome biogenesis protein Tsr3